jgi:hypothetical protein
MSVDQLEDDILNEAFELFEEACRDLRVRKNLNMVRARIARLKHLTDQLAVKSGASLLSASAPLPARLAGVVTG